MFKMSNILLSVIMLAGVLKTSATVAAQEPLLPSAQKIQRFSGVAERVKAALNADDQDAIQEMLEPALRSEASRSTMTELTHRFTRSYGKFIELGNPAFDGDKAVYRVQTELHRVIEMKLTLDGMSMITTLGLWDAGPAIRLPERNSVRMRLPFDGIWKILQGGSTLEENRHRLGHRSEQFAIDFIAVDDLGRSHRSTGYLNDEYFAYGRDVLASAPGTVVTVVDGIPDNRPGLIDVSQSGNAVIIRQAEFEYSLYLHLKPYGMRVRPGDKVEAGQILGLCGNSGNSAQPHLHFQLMNAPTIPDSDGIPIHFDNVASSARSMAASPNEYQAKKNELVNNIAKSAVPVPKKPSDRPPNPPAASTPGRR